MPPKRERRTLTHMAEVNRELLEFADAIAQNRQTPSGEA